MEELEPGKKKYISWPVIALMDFVTVIGFDDIIYNFQNQGLSVVFSWILLLFVFVVPYELMVGHLGSVFSKQGGGLQSWVRGTSGDRMGYIAAWTYWVAGLPYLVDVANSMVVSFGWLINGNANLDKQIGTVAFGLLTAVIFVVFIFTQHHFKNSLQWLSILGGGAMFIMTVLFVAMTFVYLGQGRPIETQPSSLNSFIPKFNLQYLMGFGLLIFAMNGAEYVAPYVNEMKNGKRDFPKAMWMLAIMTGFLTIFGSFSLGVFFNAHHLPHDLKMNGSYYAFLDMGQQFGMGKTLMYIFAITQAIYMMAQLAVLLDGGTRMFLTDTARKYLPKFFTKLDDRGLPINGYWLTTAICTVILVFSSTLPTINNVFNQLLNLNGIVSPYVTGFIFWAFYKVRKNQEKFPSDYVYIKNRHLAMTVGLWCFGVTMIAATLGIFLVDGATPGSTTWWHTISLNIIEPIIMVAIGVILPLYARYERHRDAL